MRVANVAFALIIGAFFLLTGCTSTADVSAPTATDEAEPPSRSDTPATADAAVTLHVFNDWDEEKDEKVPDTVYTFSAADAAFINDLFRNHDEKILNSPLESVATIQFQMGSDYLCSTLEDLGSLDGSMDGNLVYITLSDAEREALYQIVAAYVPMKDAPTSDAPLADGI